MDPINQYDYFEFVTNKQLEEVYYQAVKFEDPDKDALEREMIRRGLLGRC
jgi:hypothetical protein